MGSEHATRFTNTSKEQVNQKRINIKELSTSIHKLVSHRLLLYEKSAKECHVHTSESSSLSGGPEMVDQGNSLAVGAESFNKKRFSEQRYQYKIATRMHELPGNQKEVTEDDKVNDKRTLSNASKGNLSQSRVSSSFRRKLRNQILEERSKLEVLDGEIERLTVLIDRNSRKSRKNPTLNLCNESSQENNPPKMAEFSRENSFERESEEFAGSIHGNHPCAPRSDDEGSGRNSNDVSPEIDEPFVGEVSCSSFIFDDDSPSEPSVAPSTLRQVNFATASSAKSLSTCSHKSTKIRRHKLIPLHDHSTYRDLCRGAYRNYV